jgi:hypothetical protein
MSGETITIIILGIIIGVEFLFIRNLLKQTEQLDDMVIYTRLQVRNKVSDALKKMKETDLRGAFESDDEVGAVFKDMKQIIEDLEKEI